MLKYNAIFMKIEKFSQFSYIDDSTNESIWGDIKYGLSKLGRYKAGGKIFGKGKTDKKARAEMEEILGKESNKLIKKVVSEVEEKCPEFPNDRRKITFLRGVIMLGQLYDSIVAATQKSPKDEGYMAPEVANQIITDLRKVVKKYLDVDLAAVYSTFENKEEDLTDEEILELYEYDDYESINEEEFLKKLGQWKDRAMDKLFGAKKGVDAKRKTTKGQSAKFQQTSGEENVESDRMNTLQSNRLPAILAGVGAALGALGWLAQTEWMKNWILDHFGRDYIKTDTVEVAKTISGGNPDSKGLVHWMSEINKAEGGGNIKTGQDILDFSKKFGGPENMKGFFVGNGGGDASKQVELLQKMCEANPNSSVGKLFNIVDGTFGNMKDYHISFPNNPNVSDPGLVHQNLFGISKQANFVGKTVKTVVTKTLVKGAGTAIAAKVAGVGKILTGVGIALVATGAVVKLLREKGQRQSRAKTLNDLLQSLVFVKVGQPANVDTDKDPGKENAELVIDPSKEPGKPPTEISKETDKTIYPIMIKNLKALRSMITTIDDVSKEDVKKVAMTNAPGSIGKEQKSGRTAGPTVGREKMKEKVAEGVRILSFQELITEREAYALTSKKNKAVITAQETHLLQAFTHAKNVIDSLKREKDGGVAVTNNFIDKLIEAKMDSKEVIKSLYSDIWEHIYGKYAATMPKFDSLYKESIDVVSNTNKRKVVAEKITRVYLRTMQFEKENLYGGLSEFGADMEEFNTTLKKIMDFYSTQNKKNETFITRFDRF
jgi:hypothetical protein